MSARVNVDASDHKGETALYKALAEKQTAVALFLMREGKASLEAKSVQELTPLMHACVQGMLECVRVLVLEKAVDVGAQDSDGLDAAFHAAGAGHVDVLSFLVQETNVVDIEREHGSKGYRLLHTAARNGSLEVVTWLVKEADANVQARDKYGYMPHHLAAKDGHLPVLQYLIREAGVPIDTETTPNRETALHLAAENGSLEVVTWLVKEAHANVQAQDIDGCTPHHVEAEFLLVGGKLPNVNMYIK